MWLIVGLGNPGIKYELTRHNAGFLAIDALLDKLKVSNLKAGFSGQMARVDMNQESAVVLKPETFMNKSGLSVQQAMSFHKIPLEQVIVLHDELDLALGSMRIKLGGGNGGHNGLKDITRLLGDKFLRIRIGIGRPSFKGDEANFVLSPFSDAEIKVLEPVLLKAGEAVKVLMEEGLDKAQQKCQINSVAAPK